MLKIINFLSVITFVFVVPLFSGERVQSISIKSSVIFNTLCAKCHEGQCSGRLSFDTGSDKASNHIKRYAGDSNLSKAETKEFFTLLNHMKKECSLLMPLDEKWKAENLSHFALPSGKGYFIPLGFLKSGTYNMSIKTKEDVHFRVEIISAQIEHFLDQSICPDLKDKTIIFTLDKNINTFLRVQSRQFLHILSIKVEII